MDSSHDATEVVVKMTSQGGFTRPLLSDIRLVEGLGLLYVASCLLESVRIGPTTPPQLLGLAFLGIWVIEILLRKRVVRGAGTASLAFVLLIMWSLVTAFWSPNPTLAVSQTATTAFLFISALAIADVFRDHFRMVAYGILTGGLIAALLTLQFVEPQAELDPYVVSGAARATFAGTDQNLLGFQLTVAVAAGCYILITAKSSAGRLVALLVTASIVAAALRVGSKTGVVALLVIALVLLLIQARTPKKLLLGLVAAGGGLAVYAVLSESGLIPLRIIDFLGSPEVIDSRLDIVDMYMVFRDEWQIGGVGAGNDADFLMGAIGTYVNAHGAHWKIWIELGFVGLVIWVIILGVLVVGASRLADRRLVLLSAGPVIAYSWSLGPLNSNTLWVIIGLALSGFMAASAWNEDPTVPRESVKTLENLAQPERT